MWSEYCDSYELFTCGTSEDLQFFCPKLHSLSPCKSRRTVSAVFEVLKGCGCQQVAAMTVVRQVSFLWMANFMPRACFLCPNFAFQTEITRFQSGYQTSQCMLTAVIHNQTTSKGFDIRKKLNQSELSSEQSFLTSRFTPLWTSRNNSRGLKNSVRYSGLRQHDSVFWTEKITLSHLSACFATKNHSEILQARVQRHTCGHPKWLRKSISCFAASPPHKKRRKPKQATIVKRRMSHYQDPALPTKVIFLLEHSLQGAPFQLNSSRKKEQVFSLLGKGENLHQETESAFVKRKTTSLTMKHNWLRARIARQKETK